MKLHGHVWTIAPNLPFTPRREPEGERRWSTPLCDPHAGEVVIRGRLRTDCGSDTLVVLVHGIAGSADSPHILRAARNLRDEGVDTLRMSLRGSELDGDDFYHAGLTADLEAAIASPELRDYRNIYVIGFSLGGHIALHFARAPTDPRVAAVVAVCPPLDLGRTSRAIDRKRSWPYRRYILAGLQKIYEEVARHRSVPTPPELTRRARTLREWDSMTVVPRYGFEDVDDYYSSACIGAHLHSVQLPALAVIADADPMVPVSTLEHRIDKARTALDVVRTHRGGHVGFPADLDLGFRGRRGLIPQVLDWCARET